MSAITWRHPRYHPGPIQTIPGTVSEWEEGKLGVEDCSDCSVNKRNVDVGFTSNPAKYIKYQPDTLEEMISIFFEGQAEVRKVRKFGKAK